MQTRRVTCHRVNTFNWIYPERTDVTGCSSIERPKEVQTCHNLPGCEAKFVWAVGTWSEVSVYTHRTILGIMHCYSLLSYNHICTKLLCLFVFPYQVYSYPQKSLKISWLVHFTWLTFSAPGLCAARKDARRDHSTARIERGTAWGRKCVRMDCPRKWSQRGRENVPKSYVSMRWCKNVD